MVPLILNILSAAAAMAAAGFWWASALLPAPKSLGWGVIAPNDHEKLKAPGVLWAEQVAKRNKWGAAFAGVAAIFSALATYSGIDWGSVQ